MLVQNTLYFSESQDALFSKLTDKKNLESIFFHTIIDKINQMNAFVTVRLTKNRTPDFINGEIEPSDKIKNIFPKVFFQIQLEQTITSKTKVSLRASEKKNEVTEQFCTQIKKSRKNNHIIGAISALAIIAILIPGGIVPLYLDGITEESAKIDTQPTILEQHLSVANTYRELGEPQLAIDHYNAISELDPANILAATNGLTTLSDLENYQDILRQYNSVIVIDSIEDNTQVMFYPEGIYGPEILIPREYDGVVLSHPKLDRLTPIVYSTNSIYPEVILSNYGQIILNSKDAKIIDYPTSDTHTIRLEYVSGPDGPHIVYPYGSDGPAMVFPERARYPFIVSMMQQDVEPEISIYSAYTGTKSIEDYKEIILSSDNTGWGLFELDAPDDEQYILVYPDGPDSEPVMFPLGAQYVQIYELPPVKTTRITSTGFGIEPGHSEQALFQDGDPTGTCFNEEKTHLPCTTNSHEIPEDVLNNVTSAETTSDDTQESLAQSSATSSSTSNGGGCRGDCEPPTLGISDGDTRRMVDDGFTYNGYTTDVESFYTPYPLLGVKVGQQNTAVLKVYDNSGVSEIRHVGLALNLHPDGQFNESDVRVELDIDFEGSETTTVHDPNDILDDVSITTDVVKCKEEYSNKECLEVTINHSFREDLEHNRFATNVWDADRNSWQNTFNHGIKPMGESLNPPDIHIGIHHGQQYVITETDENKAVDEDGNMWTFDREWKKDYISKGKIIDGVTMHGIDRNNAWFDDYKSEHEKRAETIFQEEYESVIDDEYDNYDFSR